MLNAQKMQQKLCILQQTLSFVYLSPDQTTPLMLHYIISTVNSRYCKHPRDLKFVSVIAGVRNSEVQKKIPQFYF